MLKVNYPSVGEKSFNNKNPKNFVSHKKKIPRIHIVSFSISNQEIVYIKQQ